MPVDIDRCFRAMLKLIEAQRNFDPTVIHHQVTKTVEVLYDEWTAGKRYGPKELMPQMELVDKYMKYLEKRCVNCSLCATDLLYLGVFVFHDLSPNLPWLFGGEKKRQMETAVQTVLDRFAPAN